MKSSFCLRVCQFVLTVGLLGCLGCASHTRHPNTGQPIQEKATHRTDAKRLNRQPEPLHCPEFRREEVERIAILPQTVGQLSGIDFNALIRTEFKSVLVKKGYSVSGRDLSLIIRELKNATNAVITPEQAVKVGKLAGASHVILVNVPVFFVGAHGCDIEINCQILRVESGLARCEWSVEQLSPGCILPGLYTAPVRVVPNPPKEFRNLAKRAAERVP